VNAPAQLSVSALESAPQQDVVQLSDAALQLQEVQGIFGIPQAASSQLLPAAVSASPPSSTSTSSNTSPVNLPLPTGVSPADLTNATPDQQVALAEGAIQQQAVQTLFYTPTSLYG
jgi:hypothetical protein